MTNVTMNKPHEFVVGDYDKEYKKIREQGLNHWFNQNRIPKLEFIDIADLVPLESQRETNSTWATQRLRDRCGLDLLALGALSVARGKDLLNRVFDGLGRFTLADLSGYPGPLPCLVYDMEPEEAAFYFYYNQERGRRNLSREATFVNSYIAGEKSAVALALVLEQVGLYIQGNTHYPVPHPMRPHTAEISYRAISEAHDKIAEGDIALLKQARDMIYTAFSNSPSGCNKIAQDLYWAVLQILVTYPQARKGVINDSIQKYLDYLAMGSSQSQVVKEWKGDARGLSGNVGVSKTLAYHFLKSWKTSNFGKPGLTYRDLGYND